MEPPRHFIDRRPDLAGWLLSLAVFIVLGGALAAWHTGERSRTLAAENERLAALSKILVKDVTVNLHAVDHALAGIIRDQLGGGRIRDAAELARRLGALVEAMPGVRGIVVTDSAGIVMAAAPADLTGRNVSQRDYFTVPRRRGDPLPLHLSRPYRSIRGDVVVSATRVIADHGRFMGVVSAVLDPGYFSDILATALYAPDMHAAILHGDGGRFVAAGAAAGAGTPSLNATAAIALRTLDADSALALQLRRDRAAVLAPLRHQTVTLGALYGALALAWAGALAWYQARRRRFVQLAADAERERIQSGLLAASEARFRTLIEEAPVAVAMARHGQFIYTNRRYNLLHGYAADADLTGLSWRAMIAPSSLAALEKQLACLSVDAPVEQRFEAIGLGHSGALIPVFKATTRVALADGPATLIFVQDISAQKTAESHLLEARDAAQAANRSKAEFLANMSHEIRTPLNAILGLAYLLERGNRDLEAATMLQKIRVAGRSLLGIINDILDVSKIEAGAMSLEHNWFALQDVIDRVAATMGVAVGDKPIALQVAPLPTLAASVLGDALRLEQLLVNLTSNAIKFTERGSVGLNVDGNLLGDGRAELTFRISDTGIGIDPAQQHNIFSPFTQADTSTTRRYGGSGLGLTICKQMVELMGGRIGVDSTPGAGSTFWFTVTLPVRPAATGSSTPDMHDLELLIASADDANGRAVVDNAQALGWRVTRVAGGAAALADIDRRRGAALPGAVVLDWHLPDDACLATAQALRSAAPDACPIVILLSTYEAGAAGTEGAHPLADAMLTTPVTTSTLYNAVLEARRKRNRVAAVAPPPAGAGCALSGLRILVVDDSEINRDVAQRILECEGAQVALAEHGRAAIDWLLAHPGGADLVLMDVQMPVMDGIEATTILRGMPQFAHLPIVALTAGAFSSHQDTARNAGMNHFIAKPFDVAATIALISRLTGERGGPQVLAAQTAAPALAAAAAIGAVDIDSGLRQWGDLATFQRFLRKFVDGYAGTVAAIRAHLRGGERAAAAAAAHKLGGAAGSVALPLVSALALCLERELSGAEDGGATLERLSAAMDDGLADIARRLPPEVANAATDPAPSSGAAAASPAPIAPLIDALLAALEESAPEPPVLALAALAPHVAAESLAPIRACVDNFDWPGATGLAQALARHHRQALAG